MIFVCKVGRTVIDRVTVDGESITYETQAARSVVETHIESVGRSKALRQFRSWSNGYVTLSEAP